MPTAKKVKRSSRNKKQNDNNINMVSFVPPIHEGNDFRLDEKYLYVTFSEEMFQIQKALDYQNGFSIKTIREGTSFDVKGIHVSEGERIILNELEPIRKNDLVAFQLSNNRCSDGGSLLGFFKGRIGDSIVIEKLDGSRISSHENEFKLLHKVWGKIEIALQKF